MKQRDVVAYLFLAFAWGLSFLVLLHVVDAFGWVGAVTLRSFVAGGTLLAFAALGRRVLRFGPRRMPFVIVGATTVAGQLIGLSYATPRIGTAMAAILVAAIPLFSMVIAHLWKLERIRAQGLVGLVTGTIGIVLLVGFPAVPITPDFLLGCAASLFSAFCAAFGSNYASHRLRGIGSLEVTIGAFLSGGLMTLPLLLVVPVPGLPSWTDLGALLVLGCVMSALTYVTYFRLVASIGATRTISVEFAVTIVAVLVGALVLDEPITPVQIAGAAVIIAGCALVLGLLPFGRKPKLKPVP
ncbi:hypothetical protein ASG39_08630 [Rhizobium sp. Leaf371]|uniref:DMT family transporter n=1 Tax=Rhizobium sp. Leaf371 TaxID=1736355 RepID=UPI000712EB3C|nr:DMT family transporter [Rhizobium sp. Leaf371]KQS65304.1 hypothetical protein ASG39_08630 [Rhizobium sp. Leaf371]